MRHIEDVYVEDAYQEAYREPGSYVSYRIEEAADLAVRPGG